MLTYICMLTKQSFINFYLLLKKKVLLLRENKTFLTCAFLLVLYLLSGYCRWIEILMCATAIVSMFFLSINNGLCVLAFLHCFTLSNITYYSCFPITITGFTVILLIKYIIGVKEKRYAVHKKILISMSIFYAVWTVLSLWNLIYFPGFYYYIYLPLAYLLFEMRKEVKISQVMNYMFGGLVVSVLFSLIFQFAPYFQYEAVAGGRFRAFVNNTNCLYIRALFILSYYMYRFLNDKLNKYTFILTYLFVLVVSLATMSKTGFLMFAFISVCFVVLYLKDDFKHKVKYVLLFVLVLLVVGVICREMVYNIIRRFLLAFRSENILIELFTFRTIVWKTYLKEIFRNPYYALFGHGILTKRINSLSVYGPPETHNIYIFLLHRFGFVGTIFLGYIIYLFIKNSNCSKPKMCAYLPLIYLLVESLVENTFNAYSFTMFIFATMILFNGCERPSNIEIENEINKKEEKTENIELVNEKMKNLQ